MSLFVGWDEGRGDDRNGIGIRMDDTQRRNGEESWRISRFCGLERITSGVEGSTHVLPGDSLDFR